MYDNVKSTNNVNFEFVFCGPQSPNYTLPENFTHIKAEVKPVQCFEIAARNCKGKALLQVVDDIEFSSGAVDLMFEAYNQDPKHIMATCKYFEGDRDLSDYQNFLGAIDATPWPQLPVCGLFDRELYHEIGGADIIFFGIMAELDIYMRLWKHGVKTVFVDGIIKEIITEHGLCSRFWNTDRPIIKKIWQVGSNDVITRNHPVTSFSNNGILSINQVPSEPINVSGVVY